MDRPVNLCRYRPLNEKNFSALIQNRLYFSSPSYFNDPLDSFVYVDKLKFVRSIDKEIMKGIQSGYVPKSIFKPKMSDEEARATLQRYFDDPVYHTAATCYALKQLDNLQRQIVDNSKLICFSETFVSAPMWAHYAEDHTGFALVYALEDLENATIYDKNDKPLRLEIMLDRINYSEEAPDSGQVFFEELPRRIPFVKGNANRRFHHNLMYYKKSDWSYEKEWRLCAVGDDVSRPCRAHYLSVRPLAVAFGYKMKNEDKKKIAYAVRDMRILLMEVYPDTSTPKLELKSRQYFPM